MAMNLNGTQIPADGLRTTTSSGIRVGIYVRERERERGEKEWYESPCLSLRPWIQTLVSPTSRPARRARLALLEGTIGCPFQRYLATGTSSRFSQTLSTATIDRNSALSIRELQGARPSSVRLPPRDVDRRPASRPPFGSLSVSLRRCQVRSSLGRTAPCQNWRNAHSRQAVRAR